MQQQKWIQQIEIIHLCIHIHTYTQIRIKKNEAIHLRGSMGTLCEDDIWEWFEGERKNRWNSTSTKNIFQ